MKVADDIRRLGFRRWYERQLIESHAYLVTAFLALILLLAGMEGLQKLRDSPMFYVVIIVIAAGAGTLMYIAWRRFSVLLSRAEIFAEGAKCPQCQTWGKFEVIATESETPEDPPESGRPHWMRVRCKQCRHDWRIG